MSWVELNREVGAGEQEGDPSLESIFLCHVVSWTPLPPLFERGVFGSLLNPQVFFPTYSLLSFYISSSYCELLAEMKHPISWNSLSHLFSLSNFLLLSLTIALLRYNAYAIKFAFKVCMFLGCVPRSRMTGSHGNSMFNILRNQQAVFQSSILSSKV